MRSKMRSKLFSLPLDSASNRPGQILRLTEFTLLKAGLAQNVGTRSASLGVTGSRFMLIPFAPEPRYRTPGSQQENRNCPIPSPELIT